MKKQEKTYEDLQSELDEVLAKIQAEDAKGNLTELLELYEQGEQLLKDMQAHLDSAKNKIKKLSS